MMPSYIVIGGRKCGSTSLCALLRHHPDVFLTKPREPKYFSRIATYDRGRAWYESLFAEADGYAARGEGSTTYSGPKRIEIAAPRIRAEIPDCRLIYIVRHPIRRLESDWKARRREGQVSPTINVAIKEETTLTTWGLYWRQLCVYRRLFPDEQILVVFLDDLARDPGSVLRRVYAHIGVDPMVRPHDANVPRNVATEFRADTRLSAAARRLPGFRFAKRIAPRPIVEAAQRALLRSYGDRPDWDPEILRAVCDLYRSDSSGLMEYCGKSDDYWNLDH